MPPPGEPPKYVVAIFSADKAAVISKEVKMHYLGCDGSVGTRTFNRLKLSLKPLSFIRQRKNSAKKLAH